MSALLDADRMTALLTAIRQQPNRHWKSGRAVRALRAAGHLIQHHMPGVTWYTLATRKDVRP